MIFPLPQGTYRWSSGYGYRTHPITGVRKLHAGVDLAAPTGTPIHAPVAGLVNQAWDPGGGGNWTNLWADDGSRWAFGHADRFAPGVNGRRVEAGTLLAFVGTTGGSTGPHAHVAYAPAPGRTYADPTQLLVDAETVGRFPGSTPTPTPSEDDMPPFRECVAVLEDADTHEWWVWDILGVTANRVGPVVAKDYINRGAEHRVVPGAFIEEINARP